MLARQNRLIKADDFRSTMRLGRKIGSENLVTYIKLEENQPHSRFGFVVAKTVGGAVKRNLVKRRMREISRELLGENASGLTVVVRALPGAAQISWAQLREELIASVQTGVKKAR